MGLTATKVIGVSFIRKEEADSSCYSAPLQGGWVVVVEGVVCLNDPGFQMLGFPCVM